MCDCCAGGWWNGGKLKLRLRFCDGCGCAKGQGGWLNEAVTEREQDGNETVTMRAGQWTDEGDPRTESRGRRDDDTVKGKTRTRR